MGKSELNAAAFSTADKNGHPRCLGISCTLVKCLCTLYYFTWSPSHANTISIYIYILSYVCLAAACKLPYQVFITWKVEEERLVQLQKV